MSISLGLEIGLIIEIISVLISILLNIILFVLFVLIDFILVNEVVSGLGGRFREGRGVGLSEETVRDKDHVEDDKVVKVRHDEVDRKVPQGMAIKHPPHRRKVKDLKDGKEGEEDLTKDQIPDARMGLVLGDPETPQQRVGHGH